MKEQKISELLKDFAKTISSNPTTVRLRLWLILNGGRFMAFGNAILILTMVYFCLHAGVDGHTVAKAFSMWVGYFACVSAMLFWATHRKQSERLVWEMITIAEYLERISTRKSLSKMMKLTKISRRIFQTNFFFGVVCVSAFVILPLCNKTLVAPVPKVLDSFWIFYFWESMALIIGPFAVFSFVNYFVGSSLCLFGLYNNLSEHLNSTMGTASLSVLIQNHQRLLEVTVSLQRMFSTTIYLQLSAYVGVMVLNAYRLISGSSNVEIVVPLVLATNFVLIMCYLGELVTSSSEKVAFSAYKTGWIEGRIGFKKLILIMLTRCQRPARFRAGLIGVLGVEKFSVIMKRCYQIDQALLNLI